MSSTTTTAAATTTATTTATRTDADADADADAAKKKNGKWLFRCTVFLLFLDVFVSVLLMSPILPWVRRHDSEDDTHDTHDTHRHHYTFAGSLLDLLALSACRFVAAAVAFGVSHARGRLREKHPLGAFHPSGKKKSRDELEEEALSQSFGSWCHRYANREAFFPELLCLATALVAVAKCLVRLDVELAGGGGDAETTTTATTTTTTTTTTPHPLFWISFLFASVVSVAEAMHVDAVCVCLGEWGHENKNQSNSSTSSTSASSSSSSSSSNNNNNNNNNNNISSSSSTSSAGYASDLVLPLLSNDGLGEQQQQQQLQDENENAEEPAASDGGEGQPSTSNDNDDDAPGEGGIGSDTEYKASLSDLVQLCKPDAFLIALAFVFLLIAALLQIYIPKYTGACLDALEEAYSGDNTNDDDGDDGAIRDVPGFLSNVKKLIVVSALGGIFSGLRGSIFTMVGGRVNVRLRLRLMDSLLTMEQGFFDRTKTGDITSRLSSDTTLVGDQVTLNVNVFLRSLVQVIGVLVFMFTISWQLSLLAFISVPVISVLSTWYGGFVRSLTKVMQTKLANGNSVSEAALSSMSTVRAFDAAPTEYKEFKGYMDEYLELTLKSAIAYSLYATISTSLPQLVTALVVFYGGLLVRNGSLSSGELVSFLLYLQSLSSAFSTIGYIFSSLTQAVGAADKIFELMHRKRIGMAAQSSSTSQRVHGLNDQNIVEKVRTSGLEPSECRGEVTLENVEMYYPARPNKRVLNGMSLMVPPGSVVALVGPSGGGKSSVISLVQNMYEQSSGKVMLDDAEVHEYSPRWLNNHVSIVQQEPTLFARSIKRNIMLGLEGTDKEPSQKEIERVAKLSNCDDFIRKMPMQYETEVGERGVQLSGGQKQRIAIARALVRKPKLLLLDEATSALDAESEHMVQSAIDHMIESARSSDGVGMSVMIVAHRLSTIRNADIIFVVQDGKVVEQGNHSELIKKENGPYVSLVRRQMNVQKVLENGDSTKK